MGGSCPALAPLPHGGSVAAVWASSWGLPFPEVGTGAPVSMSSIMVAMSVGILSETTSFWDYWSILESTALRCTMLRRAALRRSLWGVSRVVFSLGLPVFGTTGQSWSLLPCAALRCTTLRCAALVSLGCLPSSILSEITSFWGYWSILESTALRCTTLHYTALCCAGLSGVSPKQYSL